MPNLPVIITYLIATYHWSLLSHAIRLPLKGGLLSIATQELLLALQPSPPGLDHGIATWHTSGG